MNTFSRAALVAGSIVALASPAWAATVVAPAAYATTDAPSAQYGILGNPGNSASTFQFVVAASQLTGITQGALISSIGFRFAGTPQLEPVGAASFSRYDIQIGRSANSVTALSSTYANNLGADTILARSGAMTVAANTFVDLPGEGPNAFVDLAFTTPYTYVGGDLAVTIRYIPTSGNPGIALDAFTADSRINTVSTLGSATSTVGTVGQSFAPVTRFTFAAAAVPEPATWAMMTLGFGAMGFAMRRKKVATRIRFA
jgi:hypothetical protein